MRVVLRYAAAFLFICAGLGHFLKADYYQQLVPPGFPSPGILVFVSGVAEVAGGVGLLIRPFRRWAGWGLIALLIAIFPANIYMALHPERFGIAPWILWARLPFQVVFVVWVWLVSLRRSPERPKVN